MSNTENMRDTCKSYRDIVWAITAIVADEDTIYQMQYASYLGVYDIAILSLALFISRLIGHMHTADRKVISTKRFLPLLIMIILYFLIQISISEPVAETCEIMALS